MFGIGFESERRDVFKRLNAALRSLIKKRKTPDINGIYEYVMGDFSIGEYPSTREMRFFLEDVTLFDVDMALTLKEKVIDYRPKWSIVPQYGSRTFSVNSKGVRFDETGRSIPFDKIHPHFEAWIAVTKGYDEIKKGPLRRQFQFISPLLPTRITKARRELVTPIAAFDQFIPGSWKGDPIHWYLVKGNKEEPKLHPGDTLLTHPVSKTGVIEPKYSGKYYPSTDEIPCCLLIAHECAWNNRRHLGMWYETETGEQHMSLPFLSNLITVDVLHNALKLMR